MLKTLILPEVVAQEGGGMSQCFIGLAGLAGSVLHLAIIARTKVPFCDMRTAGSRGHLGRSRKKAKWPPVTTPLLPAWSLHSNAPLHGLFSDRTLLVLAVARNSEKEPYCCWFVGMQQLSGEKGNIKKQLIYWSAKGKRETPRPPVGLALSAAWPENAGKHGKDGF